MKKSAQLKNSTVIFWLLTVLSCQTAQSEEINSIKFWQFINNVKLQLPYGLEQVTHLFNGPFFSQAENDTFITYENKGLIHVGEVNIESIEARVFRKNNKVPFLLSFQVGGTCITLAELKQNYSDLTLTDVPRGRSLEEETSYSTVKYSNNVKLSFGFAEKNPDCINSVVFSID